MRLNVLQQILGFGFFSLTLAVDGLSTCIFPSFLKENTLYRASYKNRDFISVYFNGDRIDATMSYGDDDKPPVRYDKRCIEELERGKYLVEVREKFDIRSEPEYTCIQFIKRSEAVVQIKESRIPLMYKSPSLCNEIDMALDKSPLIATPLTDHPRIKCPFTGGYNLKVVYKNKKLCMSEVVPPRMESECEDGDGISFDFRHSNCLPDELSRGSLVYKMSCIATWKQGKYIFSVLSDMNHAAPWCLRIQEPVDDLREAHIFLDTICDPGDASGMFSTINMLILDLNKMIIPSMCADEFEGCSDVRFCQTNYRPFCHRTCGICKDDVDLCSFPESLNGNWLLGNNDGKSDVMRVETYKIDVPGSGRFHCLAKNVSGNNERIMLLHVFENGCYPRFACLEKRKHSKSTLLFRIGTRLNWPDFPFENTKAKTCKDDKFKILADTGTGNDYVDLPMTPAMDASEFSTLDCKLPDYFGFRKGFLYFRDNDSKCDVCFSYMPSNRNDLFDVTSVNYTDNCPKYPYSFYCGASFNFSDIETHAVITGTIEDRRRVPNFLCWAFVGKGEKRKMIILNSSGCNKLTIQRAINGVEQPLAIFYIREKERNICTLSWPIPSNPIRPTTRLPPIRTDEPTYRPINDAGRLSNMAQPNMAPSIVCLRTLGLALMLSYFLNSFSEQR